VGVLQEDIAIATVATTKNILNNLILILQKFSAKLIQIYPFTSEQYKKGVLLLTIFL